MELRVTNISEDAYKSLNYPVLFEDKKTDRVFATITNETHDYKFAWQSTIINPVIFEIVSGVFAIGVDLNFVVIDFNLNAVKLKITLDFFLYDIKVFNGLIYVITELEILEIKKNSLEIIRKRALPDIFEEIKFNNQNVVVKCFGDLLISI